MTHWKASQSLLIEWMRPIKSWDQDTWWGWWHIWQHQDWKWALSVDWYFTRAENWRCIWEASQQPDRRTCRRIHSLGQFDRFKNSLTLLLNMAEGKQDWCCRCQMKWRIGSRLQLAFKLHMSCKGRCPTSHRDDLRHCPDRTLSQNVVWCWY